MNPTSQQITPNPKPNSKPKWLFLVFVGIALLFVILCVAFALTKSDKKSTNQNANQVVTENDSAEKTAVLTTEPASAVSANGEITTISLWVDSGAQQISTVEAYLIYPENEFEFVNIDSSGSAFEIQAEQTGGSGKISITRAQVGGVSGKQLLAKVNLKPKSESSKGTLAYTDDSKIYTLASEPQNILNSTSGATLTVGE